VVTEDGRCELRLVGSVGFAPSMTGVLYPPIPIIHGQAEGKPFTLLGCLTLPMDWLGRDDGYHDLRVQQVLAGAHVDADDAVFSGAVPRVLPVHRRRRS
jgi:hypothetical protein